MRISDALYALAIPTPLGGHADPFYLSLLLDANHGPTLIDTGLPGQVDLIRTALAEAGVTPTDLTTIILTHQDIDHVGSLHELVALSGAQVLASVTEAPTIDGSGTPRFLLPEILAERPLLRPMAERFKPVAITRHLADGERLNIAGGLRVILTPGHTPGHLSLYHEPSRTLISGDALTAANGTLNGPAPGATLNMATAMESVRKLAALDVQTIVCYHGGVVNQDANAQLQGLAQG